MQTGETERAPMQGERLTPRFNRASTIKTHLGPGGQFLRTTCDASHPLRVLRCDFQKCTAGRGTPSARSERGLEQGWCWVCTCALGRGRSRAGHPASEGPCSWSAPRAGSQQLAIKGGRDSGICKVSGHVHQCASKYEEKHEDIRSDAPIP